jgi:cell wall-associated NlpC family hydrolase
MSIVAVLLGACSTTAPRTRVGGKEPAPVTYQDRANSGEIVMYALGLMDIDYRFGGDNPESGLDCSGMVSYIYNNAVGIRLPHNAYEIARLGREITETELQPGDLVFFNTLNRPYSHVGIYIGNGRFIHAPSTNGKIRVSSLKNSYYAKHYEGARSFFINKASN